jgi:hypothetical protein
MKRIVLTLCAALISAAAVSAQPVQDPPKPMPAPAPAADAAATVAGNWTMSLDAGQGPMDIGVMLKLDGKKLTGTLSSQMGETPLEGEFAEKKATFAISFDGGGGAMTLTFTGLMKDNDNMTGTMSGPMGEIPWVAKRVKG